MRAGSLKLNTDHCVWVGCNFFDIQLVRTGLQGGRKVALETLLEATFEQNYWLRREREEKGLCIDGLRATQHAKSTPYEKRGRFMCVFCVCYVRLSETRSLIVGVGELTRSLARALA